MPTSLVDQFRKLSDRDGSPPLVTYYNDAAGERVELSYATVANWVAKTAGFIQDVVGATPGERISLLLPTHWPTLVWHLACQRIGVISCPELDPAIADHVAAAYDRLNETTDCPGERIALSLHPLGLSAAEPLPARVLD